MVASKRKTRFNKMTCSYCCTQTNHNISNCQKAAFTRAFELYNEGTDSFANKRSLREDWLKDNDGNNPSDENWRHHSSNRRSPAEFKVIEYIHQFRRIRPNTSSDGHNNMDYYVTKINSSPPIIVKVLLNNENKLIATGYQDNDEGITILATYTRYHRRLINLRATHRTMIWRQGRAQRHAITMQQQQQRAQQRAQQQQQQQQELLVVMRDEPVEATDCPICMEPLANTNKTILRCGHQFCGDCIFQHFQGARGTNCPQCRAVYAIRVRGWHPPAAQPPNQPRHNGLSLALQ